MHSNDTKAKLIALRAKGVSFRTIAEQLNISKTTASEWGAELETQINNYRAFELEAIQEQYLISFEAEMALLGDEFRRVMARIARTRLRLRIHRRPLESALGSSWSHGQKTRHC